MLNYHTSAPAAVTAVRKEDPGKMPIKPKKKDDDEIPFMKKPPRNPYNMFVASESVKIKEQNPHMRAPDIVRLTAQRYNSMTP